MTILTKLETVQTSLDQVNQPVLSVLNPVQQQQQEQQQLQQSQYQTMQSTDANQQAATAPPIIHHLVQQPEPQPHFHILRAPSSHPQQQQQQQQEQGQDQEQHLQQSGEHEQVATRQHSTRSNGISSRHQQQQQQRNPQQIEGIVADGGGPIVQWLLDNYEIADGESLPRSTVYNHYLIHCRQLRMSSVNAASFGKLIRSVFVGLKTRRLGTRGHSKYHYFGVRAKQHVRLEWMQDSGEQLNSLDEHQKHRGAGCSSMFHDVNQDNSNTDQGSESDSTGDCHSGRMSSLETGPIGNNATSASKRLKRAPHEAVLNGSSGELDAYGQTQENYHNLNDMVGVNQQYVGDSYYHSNAYSSKQQDRVWSLDQYDLLNLKRYLGPNSETLVDDNWPQIDSSLLESQLLDTRLQNSASGCTDQSAENLSSLVEIFESLYKCYYKRMVELLNDLNFADIEHLWAQFWLPSRSQLDHECANQWPSVDATTTNNTNGNNNHQLVSPVNHLAQQQQQHVVYDLNHHERQQQQQPHHNQQHHHHQNQLHVAQSSSTAPICIEQNSLSSDQMYQLTSHPNIIERINQIDYKLLSAIQTFLIPNMLQPMPRVLIHRIRVFARDFGTWIERAIKNYNQMFVLEKMKSVRAFEYALRRHSSINHLATSSLAIWTKRSVLAQMSADLNGIELRDIEQQVSLMNQAKFDQLLDETSQQRQNSELILNNNMDQLHLHQQLHDHSQRAPSIVTVDQNGDTHESALANTSDNNIQQQNSIESNYALDNDPIAQFNNNLQHNQTVMNHNNSCMIRPAQLIQNFLHLLDDPYPANTWPNWCRNLVESRVCGQSLDEARNFILKWNFYVSLILRELTLKSAQSLGSFQLIRLLFDEYMYYLVVIRLAEAQQKTSIQLLTNSIGFEQVQYNVER